MNAVNNGTDNILKQSGNGCVKTPAIENWYKKLENSQTQIENLHYTCSLEVSEFQSCYYVPIPTNNVWKGKNSFILLAMG